MRSKDQAKRGIGFALVCLAILGTMPIISNSRPIGFHALSFAFFLSIWQLLFVFPLVWLEYHFGQKGIFGNSLSRSFRNRVIILILLTGSLFGVSTYTYVAGIEKAGTVSAAIAIQAYPLFAIILETIFLKRRKSVTELFFTMLMLGSLYYLGTSGTWRIDGLSGWFLVALSVPLLWSIAHVTIKEVLDRTPITPVQVTFFRVLISAALLGVSAYFVVGGEQLLGDALNIRFQFFALLLGVVYCIELIIWFYAVRFIDVSTASSITAPWPGLTLVLAFVWLNEPIEPYQVIVLLIVIGSVYGLLFAGLKKRAPSVRKMRSEVPDLLPTKLQRAEIDKVFSSPACRKKEESD